MGISTSFLKSFRTLSMSDKSKFISENLYYASSEAVAEHVETYLFDILDEIEDKEYIANYLREKGYEVNKKVTDGEDEGVQ